MKNNIKISVVIPAYNGEKYLRACIESVLNQVRAPDEILIVDDASTDNTSVIAKSDEYSGRIKYYYNNEPTGFVDAWNRAIGFATGDYVTILHQDDMLASDYHYHVERALNRYPQVLHVYSACNYIDSSGKEIKSSPGPHSLDPVLFSGRQYARNYMRSAANNSHIHRCPGVTTSRELLLEKCTYRKEAGHIADDDFFLRVGAFTDVIGISEPLASYRNHSQSETGKLENLSLQLARDYVYQAGYHRGVESLLDIEELATVDLLAVKFINLLLFQSLISSRNDWTIEALRLSTAYREISSGAFNRLLPLWAKPMWQLVGPGLPRITAKLYARLLRMGNLTLRMLRGSVA